VKHNFQFDNVDTALPVLMGSLLSAEQFDSRAGNTRELRHIGITLNRPWEREITLESRKANIAAQIVETMWVLAGRSDVAGLAPYLPRAVDFSDDGRTWRSGYGRRLRNFNGVDQLAFVAETLRTNPGSRQAVINLWDPTVDSTPGKDVACNNWLSFSSRHGALDLHVGIRSNDAMWGWSGINAFEWSVLLEVVAGLAGLEIGSLHFSTTSFHLYEQHWAKAGRIAGDRLPMLPTESPAFNATMMDVNEFDALVRQWFRLEERIRTGEVVDVEAFSEPMMQSWLRVLQWYWSGDETFLEPLVGTRLYRAALVGLAPAGEPQEPVKVPDGDPFLDHVNALHADKHAAYGDSWKRRGEPGILGNIARKVDRIDSGKDTSDETQADTAQDLMVYLAKYRCWLMGQSAVGWDEGNPLQVAEVLEAVPVIEHVPPLYLDEDLGILERATTRREKLEIVDRMLEQSMALARSLWLG